MAQDRFFADLAEGWEAYQGLLIEAIGPLNPRQLELRAGGSLPETGELRSAGMIAAHIVGTRVLWLRSVLKEGDKDLERWLDWGRQGSPVPSALELVHALEETWKPIKAGLGRWTAADYAQTVTWRQDGQSEDFSRGWVVYHLIEHDLHHGGELSLLLGSRGLPGIELP